MNDKTGLKQLRAALDSADRSNHAVSQWSVGMHIQHCCLGMRGICEALASSSPPAPGSGFSPLRAIVLATGKIPRGRAKSPDPIVPGGEVAREELERLLDESEQAMARAADLDQNAWFRHFAFGVLTRDRAIKFLAIHNRHHLAIINDIVSASGD